MKLKEDKNKNCVTVENVIIQPNKIQPILVSFQNGQLKEEVAESVKCGLFQDENKKIILGIASNRMVYKGERPNPDQELMQTMIGIYNKETGTIKLIACERYDVAPVLDKEADVRSDFDENAISNINKQFGSKRAKRRAEEYEKMNVNFSSVHKQLEEAISNIQVDTADLAQNLHDDFISNNLPHCNRDAADVFEVYNPYDIIPKHVLKSLYDMVDNVVQNGIADDGKGFFSRILEIIEKGSKLKKKVSMLIYLRVICKWLEMPIKEARKILTIKEKFEVPDLVATQIINTYTIASQNARQRPPMIKDKAVIHCLILVLMLNNYSINLEEFAQAVNIRVGVKKLVEFARIMGLTASKEKNIYTLKLPLPPPLPAIMIKKTKRK